MMPRGFPILILTLPLALMACSSLFQTKEYRPVTNEPDFYLYRGDGDQRYFDIVRSCWKGSRIKYEGRDILIVSVLPTVHVDRGDDSQSENLLGLAERSSIPFEVGLSESGVGDVVVFRVVSLDPLKLESVGIGAVWKDKPKFPYP
jgi:hypothetical protein